MGGTNLFNLQIYSIAKSVWCGQRYTHKDQCNRTEDPEIGPYKYAQWILTKAQKQFNARNTACSTNAAGAIGHP